MIALFALIDTILGLLLFLIIASVIMSWLVAFNVINTSNRFVYMIGDFLHRVTEPMLGPIRRFLPNRGGLDISPVILILIIYFLQNLIRYDIRPMFM